MKITLVHVGALGDTILLLPLTRSLRTAFPGAWVSLVTRPSFGALMHALGAVNQFYHADAGGHALWFARGTPSEPMPWCDGDLLLSAVSNGNDAWAAHAARHSRARLMCFEPRPPVAYGQHVTDFHREQLGALGLPPAPAVPRIRTAGGGAVVIHPGAGSREKCWPLEYFEKLARELQGLLPVRWVLGEVERERFPAEALTRLRRNFDSVIDPSLRDLATFLAGAHLYVGNDSGVSHLAAAVGTPTIAIFGPSDPVQWAPVGPQVHVISANRLMPAYSIVREKVFSFVGLRGVQ